ncbi:MAG: DEAD/DEAH box helicase [Mycobacteriales bacterium]
MPVSVPSFADLGVPRQLVDELAARDVLTPFPIQAATLPDALAGADVLGRGRTGSGKTLAFALPVVTRLMSSRSSRRPARPRALILVPTRELATQVAAVITPLARTAGLHAITILGGVAQARQTSALRSGVDIVIACPGRLEDLIAQRQCALDGVEITVLDEADHMADLGFLPAVRRILDLTPKRCQRMLFSATLDSGVDVLVRRYLHQPRTHEVDSAAEQIVTMTHHVLTVEHTDKAPTVRALAGGQQRSLLFTRTKHGARKLAQQLTKDGIPAVDLHGNLAQNARERNLDAFRAGRVRVLVATDIAARGIHVDDIGLVVHVDPPAEHKAYLHRSGRTARAGASGVVVTVAMPDQLTDVHRLMRQARVHSTATRVRADHALLAQLRGPLAGHVDPATVAVAAPAGTRRPGGGRGTRNRPRHEGGRGSGNRSHGPLAATSGQPRRAGRPQHRRRYSTSS